MNWTPVLGRCQEPGHFTKPTYFLGLVCGPVRLFFKLNQFYQFLIHLIILFFFSNLCYISHNCLNFIIILIHLIGLFF